MSASTVRAAVEAAVPGWFGEGATTSWNDSPVRHTWSWQYRLTVRTSTGRFVQIVVKVPVWNEAPTLEAALAAGSQEDTRGEADALEAITAAVMGVDGVAAVRVFGYLPAINAIVMEWIDARPLQTMLLRVWSWRMFEEILERTGRWLSMYHLKVGGMSDGALPADLLRAKVRTADAVLRDHGFDPSLHTGSIETAISALEGRRVLMTRTHGDFTLANVLVTAAGDVVSLDPNRHPDVTLMDLARVIVDLRTHISRAMTLGMIPTRRRLEAWEDALVKGYGAVDRKVLELVVAITALQRWAESESRGLGLLHVVSRRLVRQHIVGEAHRAVASLGFVRAARDGVRRPLST